MLVLVGFGFGFLFNQFPYLTLFIKVVGTLYLIYLAYLIAKSSSVEGGSKQTKPMGFIKGALFQWVNGKAWIVAIGAMTAFTDLEAPSLIQNLTVAATFLLLSFPCVGVWLAFGTLLRKKLTCPTYLRRFNLSMSFLLLLSVLPVLKDILEQT